MRKYVCIIVAFALICSNASAFLVTVDHWYQVPKEDLYNAKEAELNGHICWTLENGPVYAPESFVKSINLKNGKVKDYHPDSGYIIQKDPDEFECALFVKEENGRIAIRQQNGSGIDEIVYEGEMPVSYSRAGWYALQTVRAYMNGWIYYIKAEDTGSTLLMASSGNRDDGTLVMNEYPVLAERTGTFCRRDADGNEYAYSFVQPAQLPDEEGLYKSIIDGYALADDGKLAWAEWGGWNDDRYRLWLEIPGEGARLLADEHSMNAAGFGRPSADLCWYDDETLLFTHNQKGKMLLAKFNIHSGEVEPFLSNDGEQIISIREKAPGSLWYLSEDKTLLAYMGYPNSEGSGVGSDEAVVPVVIDLKNGKTWVLYQNKIDDQEAPDLGTERRRNGWQLSWYKQ